MTFRTSDLDMAKLAYLSGILAGDGSISIRREKHEYCIKCVGNPKDEMEFYDLVVAPLFADLFYKKIFPKFHDSGKTYGISVYSKEIVLLFSEFVGLPVGRKNELRLPEIFHKPELAIHFLRGVFDTDGCLCFKKRYSSVNYYPVISISSKCRSFILELSQLLVAQGFKPNLLLDYVLIDERFNEGYSKINRLTLNGRKNLIAWLKIIGTKHPKNLIKIEKWKDIAGGGFEFGISPSV